MTDWRDYLISSRSVLSLMDDMQGDIARAAQLLSETAVNRKPILVCGNGGSAADAMHFAAELTGRFKRNRRPVNCRALTNDGVFMTAWANDEDFHSVFARQVAAYGEWGGALIAISTSGSSRNVNEAIKEANVVGMLTLALTGERGMKGSAPSMTLRVPSHSTPLIQQAHQVIYHYLAMQIEEAL